MESSDSSPDRENSVQVFLVLDLDIFLDQAPKYLAHGCLPQELGLWENVAEADYY